MPKCVIFFGVGEMPVLIPEGHLFYIIITYIYSLTIGLIVICVTLLVSLAIERGIQSLPVTVFNKRCLNMASLCTLMYSFVVFISHAH